MLMIAITIALNHVDDCAITIALKHRVLNLYWLNHADDRNNYSLAASSLEFRLVESC